MYTMWLKAHSRLPLQGQAEVPRGWKSVLILAEKMGKELHEAGIDVHSLTDRQLKEKVRKQLQGGSVSLDTPLTKSGHSFRRGVRQWFEAKRRWCLAMLMASILLWGGWGIAVWKEFMLAFMILVPCLFLGSVFAIGVGSTIRSSLLMMLFWSMLGVIINVSVYSSGGFHQFKFL
ncbi:hypothetical protein F4818DRAFT_247218 [Hypoxylon cercidicola]|nr:hypothetical protein F4818DRAFT_247218 [Hypoxylon cercidicola]